MFSQEAEAAEGLSEGDERGGERQGAGAQSSAAHQDPPSHSRSRRNRGRGRQARAPDSDRDDIIGIDVDRLIEEVREQEPLWHMGDRRHADTFVTRRLWEEVCWNVLTRWEDLDPRQQTQECERLRKRWRSLRDRFKREFNEEMQAPSGSA
ncbi:uncharacterized protein LOC143788919 isoform X2 [Ranitomeya variabilis]|uniref:uncharacterized protein LOC143788919 isoform X2 n=1 Tax=Ranitomeya variabilis TaxID=490064 RepID=UPI0040561BED